MAEQLTWQQKLAVEDRGGNLLVSAAAGSGKTKVLVERLLKYITDPVDPANIDDFLVITYTKAAASELRGKIAKALTQRIAENPGDMRLQQQFQRLYLAKISTVHSFCSDILREYAYRLELSGDFRMAEEQECQPLRYQVVERLLAEAYDTLAQDPDLLAFVDTQGVGRSDRDVPELILEVYDSARCHKDPDAWLQKCVSDADVSGLTDASQTVWGRYLMDELFYYVDMQLDALDKMAQLCDSSEGLSKMAEFLRDIGFQLQRLREAKSWDEIHHLRQVDYHNLTCLNRVKKDKEVYEKAKAIRAACMEGMDSRLRPFGNDSSRVLEDLSQIMPAVRGLVSLVRNFSDRFDRLKKGLHIVDFSDLEHKALDLLVGRSRSGPTTVAHEIGQRFREILVDEYQDSNEVQDAIFSALTGRQNLFMVGDVKQSIYQFRLADPGIFLDKYARYGDPKDAAPGEGRKIVLSNNFRSCGPVIDAVNDVFRCCMSQKVGGLDYGDAEALWEGRPHELINEPEVELHVISTHTDVYAEEAAFVAERIGQLLDGTHMVRDDSGLRPICPEDIVILLRSPKTMSRDFQYALARKGYRTVSSTGVDLLQTEEVDWLRSLLQTINNPRQDIPLIAAMAGPVFGFTSNDLASIRSIDKKSSFYDALSQCESEKSRRFLEVLSQLRQIAKMHTLPELIEHIFAHTHADAVYAAMEDGSQRSINLQDFYQFVVQFDSAGKADLQQLLTYLQQSEEKGLDVSREVSASGCIQIASIHKSKGLEYPVVFLCGLSRAFNMASARGTLLSDQHLGLGLSCVENDSRTRYPSVSKYAISAKIRSDSISEEMRVLYVAMTRPKDRLIMTYAKRNAAKALSDLTARMDMGSRELITADAGDLGTWVLYCALGRVESGALFEKAGRPDTLRVSDNTWHITFTESEPVDTAAELMDLQETAVLPAGALEELRTALSFRYPYEASTTTPSKQTATQRKGRFKDAEAAENAPPEKLSTRHWRKPSFAEQIMGGREYGNAMHAALQHIRYAACTDACAVEQELLRLVRDGFLSQQQLDMVDKGKIAAFFASEFGTKLRLSQHVLREFKFSILDDAADYVPGLSGEKVLLQGVVDCALVEPDGITVVDFKTDYVTVDTMPATVDRYRIQVETYAEALSRIFELPIKAKALYFFSIDDFCWI